MGNYYLIRHGTTAWVDQQLLHGITDIPLNDRGRHQAQLAAQVLKDVPAKKLYTSSLSRCVETAQIIGKSLHLTPIPMEPLVEADFGWMEGKKIRDHDNGQYSKWVERYDHFIMHLIRMISGESDHAFRKRVVNAWKSILRENPGGITMVVAHSAVLNAIVSHHFGSQYLEGDSYYRVQPASITEISINDSGEAQLVRLNDHRHMEEFK